MEMLAMLKMGREKDPENILREKLAAAIEKMSVIDQGIDERLKHFRSIAKKYEENGDDDKLVSMKRDIAGEINREIGKFNRAREYAKLRYYYLIVTREAMGMRRHHWVDEWYRIPPRKPHFRDT
jgi:hypothetical protein